MNTRYPHKPNKRWLVFANAERCDHYASLKEAGFISWKRERNNFSIGDTVYIFSSKQRRIIYSTVVVKEEMRADGGYWLQEPPMHMCWRLEAVAEHSGGKLDEKDLMNHGFKGGRSLQRPVCGNSELLDYIESEFNRD